MSRAARPRRRLTAEARRELIERAATELFAEQGYHGAGMDEIAARAGISAPVLYDHFGSKSDLHRALLERHFAELRALWAAQLGGEGSAAERTARSVDAWFAYVETHPFAWRMLFRDTTGDPEVAAIHRDVAARSRAALLPLLAGEPAAAGIADSPIGVELLWEVVRGVLQGLALWWLEHPEVPRAAIVTTAMNGLWVGLERMSAGERWAPGHR